MNELDYFLIILLMIYATLNVAWIIAMVVGRLQGYGFYETPSEKAEQFNVNLAGGIIIFILGIIICPLWSLLLWTYKLFYFLFHIGLKD